MGEEKQPPLTFRADMAQAEKDAMRDRVVEALRRLPPETSAAVLDAMQRGLSLAEEQRKCLVAAARAVHDRNEAEAHRLLAQYHLRLQDIRPVLTFLREHNCDVEVSLDGKALEESYRELMAMADALLCMRECRVGVRTQGVLFVGPENPLWPYAQEGVAKIADDAKLAMCDAEHLLVWCKMTIPLVLADQLRERQIDLSEFGEHARIFMPSSDELRPLQAAARLFRSRHGAGEAPPDYAPGIEDIRQRLMHGAARVPPLHGPEFNAWVADLDMFTARCGRHEYTLEQAREVLRAVQAGSLSRTLEFDALEKAVSSYLLVGPAHLQALEQQWRAVRVNGYILQGLRTSQAGALQAATVKALKDAEAYCWAPQTVEAVHSVADGLPPDCALSATALGDLALPGKAGWWWFQREVPVQAAARGALAQDTAALLWRRGVDEHGAGTWLTTMICQPRELDGRVQMCCIPSAAWLWRDGDRLDALERIFSDQFSGLDRHGDPEGLLPSEVGTTTAAAVWFSRFFMAAAMWLRQRVVTPTPGQGVRGVARQLQRQHKLPAAPSVQIIELRRRELVTRLPDAPPPADGDRKPREYSCRFVVHGFTRNQWYPSRKEHAPKWIDPYVKGPDDKPFREVPRVYAVRR
jgi:hypothetical protein